MSKEMTTDHIRIDALIAGLPGLFGFVPEQSLSIVLMKGTTLVNGMRADLMDVHPHTVQQLADLAANRGDGIIVVIHDTTGMDHEPVIDALLLAVEAVGVRFIGAYITDGPQFWRSTGGKKWPVPDARDSVLGADAVRRGVPFQRSRAEMIAVFAPAVTVSDDDLEFTTPYTLQEVGQAIGSGDVDYAALALAIGEPVIRDRVYALALGSDASKAEEVFTRAARALPGVHRANALTIVALLAYCRGDGSFAVAAVTEALTLAPFHKMGRMIDTALQAGIHPNEIRKIIGAVHAEF